jgi:hypothetical protein
MIASTAFASGKQFHQPIARLVADPGSLEMNFLQLGETHQRFDSVAKRM